MYILEIHLIFLVILFILFVSCKNENNRLADQNGSTAGYFGEKIDTIGMISYENLLKQMATSDSVEAKVYGKVSAVCQTKGCWMNIISDSDTTKTEMFVEFLDYGFFMPKDIAGKEVVMKGKAYVEETSVEDLKHFAEDEGLTEAEIAKITEPKVELKFMASGVMIKP